MSKQTSTPLEIIVNLSSNCFANLPPFGLNFFNPLKPSGNLPAASNNTIPTSVQ